MANYSQRIKELRTMNSWTQTELAQRVFVSKQAISQYEHGIRKPDQETLLALCDVFNVSSDYLLGIEGVTMRFVDPLKGSLPLFNEEWSIIDAYRKADSGTRAAVLKLLDINVTKKQSSVS